MWVWAVGKLGVSVCECVCGSSGGGERWECFGGRTVTSWVLNWGDWSWTKLTLAGVSLFSAFCFLSA